MFVADETTKEPAAYHLPCGRTAIEAIPDHRDLLRLRVVWLRGKRAALPLFETTPLRPIAEVICDGQTFPLAITGHKRERRDRVVLTGERPAGRAASWLCAEVAVTGRKDRLTWTWRVAHRSGARRRLTGLRGDLHLHLPLPPGSARFLSLPGVGRGVAVWQGGIVTTVVPQTAFSNGDDAGGDDLLTVDACGVHLRVPGTTLGGAVLARLETFFAPAATEKEARLALLRHLADQADRAQQRPADVLPSLGALSEQSAAALMDRSAADKRGGDKLVLRSPEHPDRHLCGAGADAALVARALQNRFRLTGDDAERRHALLLTRGVCDFAVVNEESTHWGAFWDALRAKKQYEDFEGNRTLSVATTARAAFGLLWTDVRFGQEVLTRTALTACQWLLLKMDQDGFFAGERYFEEGAPVPGGSPWVAAEALRPLVEAFRRTGNETFLKAALRVTRGIDDGLGSGSLSFASASAEHLAAAVEGILYASREAESAGLIDLAKTLGLVLRARRLPDGAQSENGAPSLTATLATARAALALIRVDPDPVWPLLALRAIRAARDLMKNGSVVLPGNHAALCALPTELLLMLAARAPQCIVDRDALTAARAWQTFEPDPSTREYISVTAADGAAVDHLALVCPLNRQVLIMVLSGPDTDRVSLHKNGREPFLKNLLTGDYAPEARLVPLGDGAEANFGVFLADT